MYKCYKYKKNIEENIFINIDSPTKIIQWKSQYVLDSSRFLSIKRPVFKTFLIVKIFLEIETSGHFLCVHFVLLGLWRFLLHLFVVNTFPYIFCPYIESNTLIVANLVHLCDYWNFIIARLQLWSYV